ncbi:hypothetical protein P5673_019121 [Acropora cervicornis]|uniref:Uncharacterized protein n=1 Tax=Acropora cervicornis TaxID=6130 RepID=A0AAD9QCM3_ACRCE|nr:hypothetical protein P5673_019121 [Acropora cervicornis]
MKCSFALRTIANEELLALNVCVLKVRYVMRRAVARPSDKERQGVKRELYKTDREIPATIMTQPKQNKCPIFSVSFHEFPFEESSRSFSTDRKVIQSRQLIL